jgi:hypothetical protein
MAVLLVFFNPAKSKRILMNFLYTLNSLKAQGIPVYAVELTYTGERASIAFHGVIHVTCNSIFFHKENLIRVLEKQIPSRYTKLMFMDADLFYSESNWYQVVSEALDIHEVVQPFETLTYLDLTYRIKYDTTVSCVAHNSIDSMKCSVGMAWAMQRSYYQAVGFYDHCIMGNGDLISASHFLDIPLVSHTVLTRLHSKEYEEYQGKRKPASVGYCPLTINHLYHGSLTNRKYYDRNFILNDLIGNIFDVVEKNAEGVLEWKDESHRDKWNPIMLNYFTERMDDDISVQSIEVKVENINFTIGTRQES